MKVEETKLSIAVRGKTLEEWAENQRMQSCSDLTLVSPVEPQQSRVIFGYMDIPYKHIRQMVLWVGEPKPQQPQPQPSANYWPC